MRVHRQFWELNTTTFALVEESNFALMISALNFFLYLNLFSCALTPSPLFSLHVRCDVGSPHIGFLPSFKKVVIHIVIDFVAPIVILSFLKF